MSDCLTDLTAALISSNVENAGDLAAVFCNRETTITVGVNTGFLIICGALVFVMHAGFAMLCAGTVRSKNTISILLQTILDGATSAICFYCVGYGFAYGVGEEPNAFIGDALFGLKNWYRAHDDVPSWQIWFFQWAFAATATTIPAGAVAERFNFNAYLAYSILISSFVYPVVVHWVWADPVPGMKNTGGWLNFNRGSLFGSGMIDYAGSGVVHMVGGLSGLMGCVFVGPRMGRFDSRGKPLELPGHSPTLVVLGTVLLWFGWYGFNPGSQLSLTPFSSAQVAGRAAVTTTLGGAAGCLSCLLTAFFRNKAWDVVCGCNGVLVGFVSITASANVVEPWAAIICGFLGGWIFDAVCVVFLKLRIDDPLSAAPMHGFCGAWGVIFVGLFAHKDYICDSYGKGCGAESVPFGCIYGGGFRLIAAQAVGVGAIAGWVMLVMGSFFAILRKLKVIRISAEEEHAGLDVSKHGGSVYQPSNQMYHPHRYHGSTKEANAGFDLTEYLLPKFL